MPEKSLAGQVALITGAAKRIGRSIALRLASEGADIIISYDTSKSEAEELSKKSNQQAAAPWPSKPTSPIAPTSKNCSPPPKTNSLASTSSSTTPACSSPPNSKS